MIEKPNDIQAFGLGIPWEYDIAAAGSRGFGKSVLAVMLAVRHALAVPGSRSVFFRQTYGSLHDAVMLSVQLIQNADPGATFNKSDLHWTFSNLSALTFAPLADLEQYRRWQGANVSGCVIFDEAQQWASPEICDLLLSNLRSSSGKTRAIYLMNPGDRGMHWLFSRFIKPAPPTMGEPFMTENGRETVLIRGTIADNPHLPKDYEESLRAATRHDPALFRAWLGDWYAIGGTFFGDVFGEKNLVTLYPGDYWPERRDHWRFYISIDWGTAAPAVALLCAEARDSTRSSDGEYHVRGDTIICDEVSTAIPGSLNTGDKSTVGQFCERVKKMLEEWEAPRRGCIDDAVYAQHGHERGPLADEFAENGIELQPARKGRRINGWSILKERLNNAEQHHGERERPAVYINRRCEYLIETLKMLAPDQKNREDCQTDGPDHAADSLRMALTFRLPVKATRTPLQR